MYTYQSVLRLRMVWHLFGASVSATNCGRPGAYQWWVTLNGRQLARLSVRPFCRYGLRLDVQVLTANTDTKISSFGEMLLTAPANRTHDTIITSLWRRKDVATSFWRHNDVIFTSCARWVSMSKWQNPVQPMTKISSKWHFRFCATGTSISKEKNKKKKPKKRESLYP